MNNNIKTIISDLSKNTTDRLSFYYQQGFEIGKEETLYEIISQMIKENIDNKIIAKVTKIPLEEINKITLSI